MLPFAQPVIPECLQDIAVGDGVGAGAALGDAGEFGFKALELGDARADVLKLFARNAVRVGAWGVRVGAQV